MRTITEKDVGRIASLEQRLIEFYRKTDAYDGFKKVSSHPHLWGEVARLAKQLTEKGKCRILELGSGMSGLPDYLSGCSDIPFYSPPSIDHCGRMERLLFSIKHLFDIHGFKLIENPSVFHMAFYRDRDAVHLVNKRSIKRLHVGYARIHEFRIPTYGWKDRIVKDYLTLRLIIRKTGSSTFSVVHCGGDVEFTDGEVEHGD